MEETVTNTQNVDALYSTLREVYILVYIVQNL